LLKACSSVLVQPKRSSKVNAILYSHIAPYGPGKIYSDAGCWLTINVGGLTHWAEN